MLFGIPLLSRMDSLRQKLESQGLRDVAYMVINHQGEQAQRVHPMLAEKLSEHITLYRQDVQQPDVWQTLGGEKDDFFIYDRFVEHITNLLTICTFFKTHCASSSLCDQVWPSHPAHFTSILHHRNRPY